MLIGENNAEKKGHYLWTEKSYKDFLLEFDVRWKTTTDRGVDTGIEMRNPKVQLQLGVSGSLRVDMTGSFYTGGKPAYPEEGQAKEAKKLMLPEGEWNRFRVQARGIPLLVGSTARRHRSIQTRSSPERLRSASKSMEGSR